MRAIELRTEVELPELTAALAEQLFEETARHVTFPDPYECSVAVVSDERMQELNSQYRKINAPTDVLSFAYDDRSGEIVIAAGTVRAQARQQGHGIAQEAAALLVHGLLHLSGLDHEAGEEEAARQEQLQQTILSACGLPQRN